MNVQIDPTDTEFQDVTVKSVDASPDGWAITSLEHGWTFYVPAAHGVEPHVGDVARFYPGGIGRIVRGLTLNGVVVFYRTDAEQRAKNAQDLADMDAERRRNFESEKGDHDRRIAALPLVFRQRLKKFQDTNPDFRWRYEDYELFTCEQAVVMADTLRTVEALASFSDASWDEQKERVPGLDDDHSGNTFGCAVRLARWYLARPELVVADHGALTPLTGCEDYGCPHGDDEAAS